MWSWHIKVQPDAQPEWTGTIVLEKFGLLALFSRIHLALPSWQKHTAHKMQKDQLCDPMCLMWPSLYGWHACTLFLILIWITFYLPKHLSAPLFYCCFEQISAWKLCLGHSNLNVCLTDLAGAGAGYTHMAPTVRMAFHNNRESTFHKSDVKFLQGHVQWAVSQRQDYVKWMPMKSSFFKFSNCWIIFDSPQWSVCQTLWTQWAQLQGL